MSITNGDGLPIVFEMDLWSNIYITVQISKDVVMILLTIFIYEIVKKVSLL